MSRVQEWGGAYGVLKNITKTRAWGTDVYETNRDRLKTMRKFGWIEGQGQLVVEGWRLLDYQHEQEARNG